MNQLMRIQRKNFLLVACCIIFAGHTACSSDSAGTDNPTSGDTADVSKDSITPSDTEPQPDTTDTTSDSDTSNWTGTVACERVVKNALVDFVPLENDIALNTAKLTNPYIENAGPDPPIPCGALATLDTSVGDEISPTSLHTYPKQEIFSAKTGEQLAVIAAEREFTQSTEFWARGSVTGLTGDVYDIENGTLERSSRKESLLEDIPTGQGTTISPLALVHGDPGIVLVTRKFLVKLTMNEFRGGLTVVETYDRTEDNQAIQTTLDEAYDGSRDLEFPPGTSNNHFMLQDRYLIEVYHGVVAWDLEGWRNSESETKPSFDYLPIPEATGGSKRGYSRQRDIVFTGSNESIFAMDLSVPDSPQRIATWRAADDFSIPWHDSEIPGGSVPDMHISGSRLYLLYSNFEDQERFRETLTVVDISSDLSTPNEIVVTQDFSFLRGTPDDIFPTEDRIYFEDSWSNNPRGDGNKIQWVSPSEISPEL